MEEVIASLRGHSFEFEPFVHQTYGAYKSELKDEICKMFLKGQCKNRQCPLKHTTKNERAVVCKHWLRGLCKKEDGCEFLHEYNLKKMPECWFYSKYKDCNNAECLYLHIDPESKVNECLWYSRGFCKHGANCRNRHIKRAACPLYLTGFCPKGAECSQGHPRWDIIQSLLNLREEMATGQHALNLESRIPGNYIDSKNKILN